MADGIYTGWITWASIDDSSTALNKVWSSQKINEELLLKSDKPITWQESELVKFDINWNLVSTWKFTTDFAPTWHTHPANQITIDNTNLWGNLPADLTNFQEVIDAIDDMTLLKGDTWIWINNITKTSTIWLVDTYTITYTDATTTTFEVTNGADWNDWVGIASILKTWTVDLIDTYTITFTDASTFDYTVTNWAQWPAWEWDMTKIVYDTSNIEKDLYLSSQTIYVNWTTWDDTGWNWTANAPYSTIQFAIDSITDNAVDKKYVLQVSAGNYSSFILKGYVSIIWLWVNIIWTEWPLVTFTWEQSFVLQTSFVLSPTTPNQSIVSCDEAWFHELNFCAFSTTTDTANPAYTANVSAWSITFSDSYNLYNQTSSSTTATEHNIFNMTGSWSVRLLRNDIETYVADENNNVNVIRDDSTGSFVASKNSIYSQSLNASYSGVLNTSKSTANTNFSISDGNIITMIWAGSGTGQVIELDSGTNDAIIDIAYNRISIDWFTTNRWADIASGDMINAYYNITKMDELYTWEWIVNIINADTDWNFIVNTDIKDLNTFLPWSSNDSLKDLFDIGFSAGWVSWGTITEPWTPDWTVTILGWTWVIRTSNDEEAEVKMFNWETTAWLTFTEWADNFVYIDYNTGSPIVSVTTNTEDIEDNENDKFELYAVFKEDATTLHIADHKQRAKNIPWRVQQYLLKVANIKRLSWLLLWETWTRNVTMNEWEIAIKLNLTPLWPIDTSWTDTFDSYYGCAVSCVKVSWETQWDNAQYDEAWTLTNYGASKYWFNDFYLDASNNIIMVYSTGEYTSQSLAENATSPTPPDRVTGHALYIGRIVFQEGWTIALSILSPFTWQAPWAVPVTDHWALSGLVDDDHTQYALLVWRSWGQTVYGSTDSWENLVLESTSNATKGDIILNWEWGNVWIWTTNPTAWLYINTNTTDTLRIKSTSTSNNYAIQRFTPYNVDSGNDNDIYFIWYWDQHANTWKFAIKANNSSSWRIAFYTASNERMTIVTNGNVWIWTTTPDTKLHINWATTQMPLSADPADPVDWNSVQWVSDWTGSWDAWDVMMKITVGTTTKIITLVDYSTI